MPHAPSTSDSIRPLISTFCRRKAGARYEMRVVERDHAPLEFTEHGCPVYAWRVVAEKWNLPGDRVAAQRGEHEVAGVGHDVLMTMSGKLRPRTGPFMTTVWL